MAGQQAGNRVRVSPFDLDGDALGLGQWAARSNAQLAQRRQAELVHEAWADLVRAGQDGDASQATHLRALGTQPFSARLSTNGLSDERGRPPTGSVLTSRQRSWLDRSQVAKDFVGIAARDIGLVPGVLRGGWRTGKDIGKGLVFLSRLTDPLDALKNPPGEAASDEVFRAGQGLVDYTRNAISHPEVVANDVREGIRGFQVNTDPAASPPADTFWGEAARNFNIGLNLGEAAFDVGSLLVGGAEGKALAKLGTISKGAGAAAKGAGAVSKEARAALKETAAARRRAEIARYLDRGYPEKVAEHFAEPYKGMGSHFLPRRTRLPALLGGGPVSRVIIDSPLSVLKLPNVSKGEFFERHYKVDPSYHGGKIRAKYGGGGWSGRDLGWTKHDQLGRLWYGSPVPLKKTVAGAGMFGAGGIVDQIWNGEGQP